MNGETDLAALLRDMKAELNEGEYVFCTVSETHPPMTDMVLGYFREKEGVTVILPRLQADQLKLSYHFIAAWITLTVHSSLSAVGLTSACAKALAFHKIPCNMVAAYFHDHIFVPVTDAQKALICLLELTSQT